MKYKLYCVEILKNIKKEPYIFFIKKEPNVHKNLNVYFCLGFVTSLKTSIVDDVQLCIGSNQSHCCISGCFENCNSECIKLGFKNGQCNFPVEVDSCCCFRQ